MNTLLKIAAATSIGAGVGYFLGPKSEREEYGSLQVLAFMAILPLSVGVWLTEK